MSEHTDGILNLNKPAGWTSHDVIARLRRVLGQRSVGHAGTLDPMATGVLLVGIGQGTRVVEYLTAGEKAYHAVIRLGMTTDTYDRDGAVTSVAQVPKLSADELKTASHSSWARSNKCRPSTLRSRRAAHPYIAWRVAVRKSISWRDRWSLSRSQSRRGKNPISRWK